MFAFVESGLNILIGLGSLDIAAMFRSFYEFSLECAVLGRCIIKIGCENEIKVKEIGASLETG